MNSIRSLASLFVLQSCLVCGSNLQDKSKLCAKCSLATTLRLRRGSVGELPHYYALEYNAVTSKLILLAKEDNLRQAREILAAAITFAMKELLAREENRINLIPIPSRPAATRQRGFLHTQELGLSAIQLIPTSGIKVLPILEIFGKVKDQSALSAKERYQNIHKMVRVKRSAEIPGATELNILFDDLVTTGASALEAVRALKAVNLPIWGLISACAT